MKKELPRKEEKDEGKVLLSRTIRERWKEEKRDAPRGRRREKKKKVVDGKEAENADDQLEKLADT